MTDTVSFKDIMDLCNAQALADKLEPNQLSIYRYFCRQYSKLFSTELEKVFFLDPTKVVLAVYENKLDGEDTEEEVERYLDTIYGLEDPEYESKKEDELQEFIRQAEEEEAERLRLGKPIHPALKEETTIVKPPEGPKSGFIDLSHLEEGGQ